MAPSPACLTAELRWFVAGELPAALRSRALAAANDVVEESRTDRYLSFEQAATAGVKLREGRLEAKALVRSLGRWKIAGGRASGIAEVWEKRSLAIEAPTLGGPTDWIDVHKRRLVWSSPGGCQAEVAQVELGGKHHWTVGFEAEGKQAETTLRRAAEQVLLDLLPKTPGLLDAPRSLSYPAWLQRTL